MHRWWLLHRQELRARRRPHLPRPARPRSAGGHALTVFALRGGGFVVVVVALLAGSCGSCGAADFCATDGDCNFGGESFLRCNLDTGVCDCIDDRGCDASESCNALGRCQAQRGCNSNEECGTDLFCDVIRGQCIAIDGCGTGHDCCVLDSQCGFGNVCDSLRQACVSGCRDEADCILGQSCAKSLGQPLGSCSAEVCGGDNLCDFGEVCSSDGACEIDNRGPYCLGCTGGVQSDDCGERGNFCLTDTINGGSFCAVDCAAGESCPFGYECRSVIIIPPAAPFCDAESCVIDGDGDGLCSLSGTRCSVDADCPIGFPGGDCLRADIGNCEIDQLRSCSDDSECADGDACLAQECRYREGAAIGHCTCTRDTDCPRDRCVDIRPDTTRGECELSGHDCFTDADCEAIITCVNGGCFIGRNCAPADGRTCRDFLDDPPLTPP